jgi:thiol-disulfide isomerase/thioredoxin
MNPTRSLLFLAGSLLLAASAPAADTHVKGAEPAHISQGAEVVLTDYLVPGKTTVFDFTSKYCGPCQAYTQPLALLHAQRADIAVVKVDINRPDVRGIDWQSPVAREFKLHSIPHFTVYGPDGKLLADDKLVLGPDGRLVSRDAAARKMVDGLINALK